jgi:transcriptional regulator of NAD metabolism
MDFEKQESSNSEIAEQMRKLGFEIQAALDAGDQEKAAQFAEKLQALGKSATAPFDAEKWIAEMEEKGVLHPGTGHIIAKTKEEPDEHEMAA